MRITGVRARTVRWSLDATGAARGRTERAAILVEVRTDAGHVGLGEAAPLPGVSTDSLADAAAGIAALVARAPFSLALPLEDAAPAPGEVVPPALAAIAALAAELTASASARFALETALASALAATERRPLAALLDPAPAASLASAVVVDEPEDARRTVAAGARCLKIKVGDEADVQRVRAIAAAAPGVALRLDANRAWPPGDVHARLDALRGLPIELVEEPCPAAHELLADALPCPLALDESLATLPDDALATALAARGLAALVLKPTLLGGLARCLALAARARAAGKHAIVTHALEGPVGTAACAELARAIGGPAPVGLAPHPALAAWRVEVPQLQGAMVRAAPTAGLGLTLDLDAPGVVEIGAGDASLSAAGHARRAPSEPAILTASRTWTWAACAGAPAPRVVVATPSVETVRAVYAALDAHAPIALLHHRLAANELARQRALVEATELPADAAAVLFTSGSTGTPRGVVLSRGALEAAARAATATLGWRDDDRWLLALSMAHAGGLAVVVRCLAARRPVVLLDHDFDRAAAAALLARSTLASLVPTQLAALLDDPAWRPPASLRAVLLGGAAAPPALLARAHARGVPFLTTYGLTESFGQLATAPLARAGDPDAPLVTLPGVELLGGTEAVPARLRVRAPTLATRYLDGAPIAPELVTADLGYVAGDVVHVVGRSDDVIITGGENVHPLEIEAVLAATPGVRGACAFGVADARWGQVVGAAVAVDASFDLVAAAASWRARLPAHARPRRLATTPALPLLPGGKPDRRAAAALPAAPVRYR